ncbi:MAG: flagellar basal-body rod protein FlgG [Clostridia bacterium]|jgi:flagellar basal-body rod protein FlgG|nr:flagellar basal-body rod protein FlgG [Clostridiales bacterium]
MMRALWTASSGMTSQQLNVDTIANNLANVNTTGYKKERAEFKDLLYVSLSKASVTDGQGRPVGLQVGHGVRPSAIVKNFTQGSMQSTGNPLDFAIDGEGFFVVRDQNDNEYYTRDGSFKLSIDGEEATMVTSSGYVLQVEGGDAELGGEISEITIDENGMLMVRRNDGTLDEIGVVDLVRFVNPSGLESVGGNLFRMTTASGEPIEAEEPGMNGTIMQNFLEASNVQVVEEMVKLITAQRAYEINSKSVQTADEMLQIANNLRR